MRNFSLCICGVVFGFGWACACGSAQGQIPEGWEIVEIFPAGTEYNCGPPDINDRGQVVFHRTPRSDLTGSEIVLYEAGHSIQLTEDEIRDVLPAINQWGHIVWSRDTTADGLLSIVRWDEGNVELISEEGHWGADVGDINNAGQVVWSRGPTLPEEDAQIFLFDGTGIHQVTDDTFSNQSPRTNELGHFVFTRYNFARQPWGSQVIGVLGGAPTPLSRPDGAIQFPDLNDSDQAVWTSPQGGVELWQQGNVTTIISRSDAAWSRINNRGDVCFSGFDGVLRNDTLWLRPNGMPVVQLVDAVYGGLAGAMNNRGEIAFRSGRSSSRGISLFTKRSFAGDFDWDGDVDLHDFDALQTCYGKEGLRHVEDCSASDADRNGFIDRADFNILAQFFKGPA